MVTHECYCLSRVFLIEARQVAQPKFARSAPQAGSCEISRAAPGKMLTFVDRRVKVKVFRLCQVYPRCQCDECQLELYVYAICPWTNSDQ